jgi:hypothetical protein
LSGTNPFVSDCQPRLKRAVGCDAAAGALVGAGAGAGAGREQPQTVPSRLDAKPDSHR